MTQSSETPQHGMRGYKHGKKSSRWVTELTKKVQIAKASMSARPNINLPKRTGGFKKEEDEYSLFAQYVARMEQLPKDAVEGYTQYQPIQRLDFDKMSRKRQILELRKIGLALDSTSEVYKLYIRDDETVYPSTHTRYELPSIVPK